jgi:signal transduction protein with GAF and PtsI domain
MGLGHRGDLRENELVIIDGYQGRVLVSPPPVIIAEFERVICSK